MSETLVMLALSPTMERGQLVKWLKQEGEFVAVGEVVAEVETDKATMELESFLEGVLLRRLVAEGATVEVGAPIALIGEAGEAAEASPASSPSAPASVASVPAPPAISAPAPVAAPTSPGGRVVASPLARKLAAEAGIDLHALAGSGPHGRIIKRDVEQARSAAPQVPAPRAPVAPPPGPWAEEVQPEPLSNMRRVIADRLVGSWLAAPHFFLEVSIEMDAALALRTQINDALSVHGGAKVSVNDLFVRACALALQEVPEVNVAYGADGLRSFVGSHIGVAVAIPEGLVVPVVRDAETKTLRQIAGETADLAARARDKKLKPHELTGSTFSISNLGMYGIDAFTAVINPPEACILAVGAAQRVPVVREDDSIAVARVSRMTLSCDHRAVDGATGAQFLAALRGYLESPILLVA